MQMKDSLATLYYIYDPMCSWCWGFRPVWNQLQLALDGKVHIQYVLGGLATDTQQPMPESMQHSIRSNWQRIQKEIPGIEFNYDFWSACKPRRSTYQSCRAVIACRMQRPELERDMILAIQQAYYLEAKNPSELDVLVSVAKQAGLDVPQFTNDIHSELCQNTLLTEVQFCRDIYIESFPSLVLKTEDSYTTLDIDYNNKQYILNQIL
jgi:putative protein-disulfide isomerase